jgi:hypothetical protein
MHAHWTRRQFLSRVGLAAAAVQTMDHLDLCCTLAADATTTNTDLFEFQPAADGVYAAIAAPQYKVNSNAAVILTNDGVVVVDSHSKPSAAKALYTEIRGVTKNPVSKIINTHFHWDHWQGNEIYAAEFPSLEIIASERTKENLTRPDAEEWVQTLSGPETIDFTHMILGHGEVASKEHLTFFKGYLTDLIASVKNAATAGGTLAEMQKTIPDQLAPQYEQRLSKYPLGRYRDRIGVNIEMVYKKVVQKA